MTKLSKFTAIAIFCLLTVSVFAQFSRNDAINLVLNTILADDIGDIDVYASNSSFTTNVELIDNNSSANPYSDAWVFFSDDNPFASWYHSSRVIYVSAIDGVYTIYNVEIYPKGLSSDYEEISYANRPDPIAMDGTAFVPDPQKVESNYNYALIIVSMDNPRNWHNTSLIYNVLMQNYNYKKENILILYNWNGQSGYEPYLSDLDGNGSFDDIDGPATWDNIQSTIANLTANLGHGDQLAVFFTGVPVHSNSTDTYMAFPVDENLIASYPVSTVSNAMNDIDCGQMIFNFDVNSAEDVMSYFEATGNSNALCQNRYLTGSTATGKKNYAEMYFSGGNYSEQLFYWASAARGYLPNVYEQKPWEIWEDFGQLGLENGGGAYASVIPNHPGDNNLDDDGDGFIQMGEAFNYAGDMNTWADEYCYLPFYEIPEAQTPYQTDEIPFVEDLISLAGLSGVIITTQIMPTRSYIMADSVVVYDNVELEFSDNCEIYINSNQFPYSIPFPRIVTNSGSTLIFGENTYVTISNDNPACIVTYGTGLEIGDSSLIENVYISFINPIEIFKINECKFVNSQLFLNYCTTTKISNCSFKSTFVKSYGGYQEYTDNVFTNSNCYLKGTDNREDYLRMNGCSFDGAGPLPSYDLILYMLNFPDYIIQDNSFQNGYKGVVIINCGWDGLHSFKDNTINTYNIYGLQIYLSNAELTGNTIIENGTKGLQLFNNSNISLKGNNGAIHYYETQRIMDNGQYEICTDEESFPYYIKWNAIVDDDNLPVDDQLIYCDTDPLGITQLDVRHNFWGNNFDPDEDFYPPGHYIYEPVFELIYDDEDKGADEQLFETAKAKFEQEDYAGAKNDFKQVVELYPGSKFANASMKELYVVEKYEANNYNDLKQYFTSNSTILSDSALTKLGGFLGNRCNIKLENWPDAISWCENIIASPPSFADSIYNIIDLGHIYLMMQNGGTKSSSYVGSMPQYIPESLLAHTEYSSYLLSLLPGDKMNQTMKDNINSLKSGELMQNVPNPFNGTTQLWYKLEEEANVCLNVYDYTGKNITTINCGTQTEGSHFVEFNSAGLPAGIYFYSLEVNGKISDSKKMNIIK